MQTSMVLSELEADALTELVNLGVSNSALSLRAMVQEEIILSVPHVTVVTKEQAIAKLEEQGQRRLVAIQQHFKGDISGRALLIFPETNSLELVRALVPEHLTLEEIIELEYEALAETGNVLLNGCLSTIANHLERSLVISLPEVIHGYGAEFFSPKPNQENNDTVLFIYINFSIKYREIQGYIAMLLDLPSLQMLKMLIDAFIERTMGGRAPT
jgi:chemotaxis protein CheC